MVERENKKTFLNVSSPYCKRIIPMLRKELFPSIKRERLKTSGRMRSLLGRN